MNTQDELKVFGGGGAKESIDTDNCELANFILIEEQKEKVISIKQDREERKIYADKAYCLISSFLIVVGVFILMTGVELVGTNGKPSFKLSDNVIITLITTTCASVLSIFLIVMRYLFSSGGKR